MKRSVDEYHTTKPTHTGAPHTFLGSDTHIKFVCNHWRQGLGRTRLAAVSRCGCTRLHTSLGFTCKARPSQRVRRWLRWTCVSKTHGKVNAVESESTWLSHLAPGSAARRSPCTYGSSKSTWRKELNLLSMFLSASEHFFIGSQRWVWASSLVTWGRQPTKILSPPPPLGPRVEQLASRLYRRVRLLACSHVAQQLDLTWCRAGAGELVHHEACGAPPKRRWQRRGLWCIDAGRQGSHHGPPWELWRAWWGPTPSTWPHTMHALTSHSPCFVVCQCRL